MDLSGIVSVSGIGGLFKVITQTKTGLLVESLTDGRRFPVYSTARVSALAEISIFGSKEDIPLKEVFSAMMEKLDGKSFDGDLNDSASLKKTFQELIPDFDQGRVYNSDIKKVFSWYNQLLEKNLLVSETSEKEKESEKKSKKDLPEKTSKPSSKSKNTTKATPKASSKGMAKTQTVRKTGG